MPPPPSSEPSRPPPKPHHGCTTIITIYLHSKPIIHAFDTCTSRISTCEVESFWTVLLIASSIWSFTHLLNAANKWGGKTQTPGRNRTYTLFWWRTLSVLSFELAKKSGQIVTCTITFRRWNSVQTHAYRCTHEKVSFARVNFQRDFSSEEIQTEDLHTPEKTKTFRGGAYKLLLIRGVNPTHYNIFPLISLLMELSKHPISSSGSDSHSMWIWVGQLSDFCLYLSALSPAASYPCYRDTEWNIPTTLQSTNCRLIWTVTNFLLKLEQRAVICSSRSHATFCHPCSRLSNAWSAERLEILDSTSALTESELHLQGFRGRLKPG